MLQAVGAAEPVKERLCRGRRRCPSREAGRLLSPRHLQSSGSVWGGGWGWGFPALPLCTLLCFASGSGSG